MGLFTGWWRKARGEAVTAAAARSRTDAQTQLSTIFANSAIGIAVSDQANRFSRTNGAFERFLGYGSGELMGTKIAEVTHPDDRAASLTLHQRMRRGECDTYQIEKRYCRKDGTVVWGRMVASAVRDANGEWLHGIAVVEDITESRRTKEQLDASLKQLEQANRRLNLYIDRAPLACIVGDSQDVVRAWNPAAEVMFGYSAAEAIGRNVYDLIATPESIAAVRTLMPAREFPDGLVLLNRRKDGSRLHCRWHFTIVRDETESDTNTIGFASDVTALLRDEEERRLLESNLRHAQKMQSLGTLAGGIAHDFNNILLAIAGNTRLAMQDLPPDHPAQISLAEVEKASTRATSVVNQILTFSHREELPQHPVNLRALLEESLRLMRATLSTRIVIESKLDAAAPIVLADPAQLHQLLVNLATNAAHAMKDNGGTLLVELHEVQVNEALVQRVPDLRVGTYHCLGMTDSGAGMSADVMERIFEPFFTTKQRGQASGLGLAVVHGIVKAHDGAIEVSSVPGRGSTFRIYLPAMHVQASQASATVAGKQERGDGQRILYLDDEEPLVYLITRVLHRLGYQVSGFVDSLVALETFKMNPMSYDAVVTDLSMPGMPGTEFARQVLQIRPDLPVVMTSGFVRTEDREQALKIGVRELLLKPNTVEGLGEVLHRLLQRRGD